MKTVEEVRSDFLSHVRAMAHYWANAPGTELSVQERCEGVAFSILAAIDGCAPNLPYLRLVIGDYDSGNDEYPSGAVLNRVVELHALFYQPKE